MKKSTKSVRLAPFLVTVLAVAALFWGTAGLRSRVSAEDLRLAEQSIRRAAVQCYALEGFYPARLAYLQEHYGVYADDAVIVHYLFTASNLMPDVTVIARE